jgi:hypothetical protein
VALQPERLGLTVEERLPNGVHRDTPELGCDGGEQAGDLDLAGSPHLVERPGAVLAAAPGYERFQNRHLPSSSTGEQRTRPAPRLHVVGMVQRQPMNWASGTFPVVRTWAAMRSLSISKDPEDHVLVAGDVFRPAARGLVVVWALTEAEVALLAATWRPAPAI